jgi:hypothetical protein
MECLAEFASKNAHLMEGFAGPARNSSWQRSHVETRSLAAMLMVPVGAGRFDTSDRSVNRGGQTCGVGQRILDYEQPKQHRAMALEPIIRVLSISLSLQDEGNLP